MSALSVVLQMRKEHMDKADNGRKAGDKVHKERHKRKMRDELDASDSDSDDDFECFARSSCCIACFSRCRAALKQLVNHRFEAFFRITLTA